MNNYFYFHSIVLSSPTSTYLRIIVHSLLYKLLFTHSIFSLRKDGHQAWLCPLATYVSTFVLLLAAVSSAFTLVHGLSYVLHHFVQAFFIGFLLLSSMQEDQALQIGLVDFQWDKTLDCPTEYTEKVTTPPYRFSH
ncbi:hypothetical protein PENANT_c012G00880 [Penicillium antarcticum]|uniref:Uncharacterized protein n=1 Tax=Penicillium antarcticum TaxID=416450 RepID=A0A1V6Q675_9EURO|nr:hypothetical protein PENANT_c012G00880 [Penicillium antarcticum]